MFYFRSLCAKIIGEIDIRKKYNINIIATKANGKINAVITPETMLSQNMSLLVLGEYKFIKKCFEI